MVKSDEEGKSRVFDTKPENLVLVKILYKEVATKEEKVSEAAKSYFLMNIVSFIADVEVSRLRVLYNISQGLP